MTGSIFIQRFCDVVDSYPDSVDFLSLTPKVKNCIKGIKNITTVISLQINERT